MTGLDDQLVGARIRAARNARGFTQQELADAVGVSRSAVAQWETARAGQVRGNLAKIAGCLGVGVGHLMHGGAEQGGPTAEDATELALLRLYRSCGPEDRAFVLRTLSHLARSGQQRS